MSKSDLFVGKSIKIVGKGVHEQHYSEEKTNFYKQLFSEDFLKKLMPFSVDKKGYALIIPDEKGIIYFAGVKTKEKIENYESYEVQDNQYDVSRKEGGPSRLLFDQLENEFFNNSKKSKSYSNDPILEILLNGNPMDAEVELWVPTI